MKTLALLNILINESPHIDDKASSTRSYSKSRCEIRLHLSSLIMPREEHATQILFAHFYESWRAIADAIGDNNSIGVSNLFNNTAYKVNGRTIEWTTNPERSSIVETVWVNKSLFLGWKAQTELAGKGADSVGLIRFKCVQGRKEVISRHVPRQTIASLFANKFRLAMGNPKV